MEGIIVSSIYGMGKLDSHLQKNETRPYLTPYTKINSKWIKALNLRPETIKLLEENTEGKLLDSLDDDFQDMTPKAKTTKAKINKWATSKSFCITKKTMNKIKVKLWNG